jgi:probable addiction module antidote protein
MIEFSRYDASEFLDSEEVITEYLSAAIERNDPEAFITALGKVAKARGMAKIAEDRGPGR